MWYVIITNTFLYSYSDSFYRKSSLGDFNPLWQTSTTIRQQCWPTLVSLYGNTAGANLLIGSQRQHSHGRTNARATATNGKDCGLFAIAYAFHAALGDDVTIMHFDFPKCDNI